ncbi:Hint domain-containing protein [Cognatishimia sp. MH4019]|uniref:Hint domain-containing protein n=1 Tax=Cognatishimia sp. MH4019 TaxID=2854030 RepID=UPI001CD25662|nr:Hint domain-containing protein [Cognatishimia sp. MH4019]
MPRNGVYSFLGAPAISRYGLEMLAVGDVDCDGRGDYIVTTSAGPFVGATGRAAMFFISGGDICQLNLTDCNAGRQISIEAVVSEGGRSFEITGFPSVYLGFSPAVYTIGQGPEDNILVFRSADSEALVVSFEDLFQLADARTVVDLADLYDPVNGVSPDYAYQTAGPHGTSDDLTLISSIDKSDVLELLITSSDGESGMTPRLMLSRELERLEGKNSDHVKVITLGLGQNARRLESSESIGGDEGSSGNSAAALEGIGASGVSAAGSDTAYFISGSDYERAEEALNGEVRSVSLDAAVGLNRGSYKFVNQTPNDSSVMNVQLLGDIDGDGDLEMGIEVPTEGGPPARVVLSESALERLDEQDGDDDNAIKLMPPCFAKGTRIFTSSGEVEVEKLKVGDRVLTYDRGLQKIRWIGSRVFSGYELMFGMGNLRPIRIRPGALGEGKPHRDLFVSPQHRIHFRGHKVELLFGEEEVLAAAQHLTAAEGIEVCHPSAVQYFHLFFDQHEILYSEGVLTESFYPGRVGLSALDDEARRELLEFFPEIADYEASYGDTVRPVLNKSEATVLASDLPLRPNPLNRVSVGVRSRREIVH